MMKVILVEDEDIVREDIRRLIDWERQGFVIAAEARNGGEGLALFHEINPDIVITDIKMPVMGGLDMVKEMIKKQPDTKFILLTAYGDFDFAREAIKLGIGSYVLKHELDGSLLLEELNKLKQRLHEEKSTGHLARMGLLRMRLKRNPGLESAEDIGQPGHIFRWEGKTGVFVFGLDDEAGMDKRELMECIHTRVLADTAGELVDLSDHMYVMFIRVSEQSSERKTYEMTNEFASRMQSQIAKTFGRTATVAIGPVFHHFRELEASFQKTKELFSLRVFSKEGSILTAIQLPQAVTIPPAFVTGALSELRERLAHRQYDQAKAQLQQLFTRDLVLAQNVSMLRNVVMELIRMFHERDISNLNPAVIESLEQLPDVHQSLNVYRLAERFKRLVELLEEQLNAKYSKKIRELLQYIHENYQGDITLNQAADRLGFSIIYTSQLFKKEVGVPFVAYITRYRIEKAKALLETGKYKVYEVSEMVGYQTVPYFCKTFKRLTGKNPGDLNY
ncbi:response regulator [Paenibacillus thalictri]|nr:response regulator [Paenibacillus thalictri]